MKKTSLKKPRRPAARSDRKGIAATVAAIDAITPRTPHAAKVIALMKEWLTDESGYDEETWPQLKKALERERRRVGARRLFND